MEEFPGRKRAALGSSGHGSSRKLIAVEFFRLHYLMVLGQKNDKNIRRPDCLGRGGHPPDSQWQIGQIEISVSRACFNMNHHFPRAPASSLRWAHVPAPLPPMPHVSHWAAELPSSSCWCRWRCCTWSLVPYQYEHSK